MVINRLCLSTPSSEAVTEPSYILPGRKQSPGIYISSGPWTSANAALERNELQEHCNWRQHRLKAIASGQLARLLINIEGLNMGLHVVEPDGETVRFVVTNDSEEALVHEIDVRIGRTALVQGIYLPFVEAWESDFLASCWRREWRYDDDDDPDPESPTNKPYRVRSTLLDELIREWPLNP